MRTWKVVRWDSPPEQRVMLPLDCPNCGREAGVPADRQIKDYLIASFGLNLVFDPPNWRPEPNAMPEILECRKCRHQFISKTL